MHFAFVFTVRLYDGNHVSPLLHLLVGPASLSAPCSACLLKPKQVVGVVSVPHLVRLSVTNPNPLFRDDWSHSFVIPEFALRGNVES